MATTGPLQCAIITPERQVLDAPVASIVFPAHDGSMGILKDRAPLVCQLGIGVLKIETTDTGARQFFIDGGFLQVLANKVVILTQRAVPADEIKRADAEKALSAANELKITNDESFQQRQDALQRARTQLELAQK